MPGATRRREVRDTRAQLLPGLVAALPDEYKVGNAVRDSWDNDSITVLGRGGSSVVLRATFRERLNRAIKIIVPRDDIRATLDSAHLLASYENEVVRLAELRHENIAKITDFGTVTSTDGTNYAFIATELIEGENLLQFAADEETSGQQILIVLNQIMSALSYMHSRRVMHCDLKPANILVRPPSDENTEGVTAVIVDLGSSKFFPPLPTLAEEDELLYLFSTSNYVMTELRLVLGNKTQNRVARKDLRRFFPYQDLFSFGRIIQELLDAPLIARKLRQAIGPKDYESLRFLRTKLLSPQEGKYGDSKSVLAALGRLSTESMAPLGVPELSAVPGRGIVLPTLAGRAAGSYRAQLIVAHPLFQRLHRLQQLDMLNYVLPGATGTRLAHTLHTYELARSAILHLLADWRFRIEVSPQDIEAILFSPLLDAIGHYHFLHMFEDFIDARKTDMQVQKAGLLRDDELLDQILGIGTTDAAAALAKVDDLRGRTLSEIVRDKLELDWVDVRRRQRRPNGALEGMLAALLACPVDVDKLSYLADDSTSSGLPFGRAIAPEPIFESLCLPTQEDWKHNSNPNPIILGVMERAISYLESGILTRYWNIQTGYWHRTNRSVQAMVKYLIASLIQADSLNFPKYLEETLHLSLDGALRWLNDSFVAAQSAGKISDESVNPVKELLLSRRDIYKRLITISGQSNISSREPDHKIFDSLRRMSPLQDREACSMIAEVLESVHPGLNIRPGEVLLDLPRVRREEAGGKVLVYTDDRREQLGDLFKISPIMKNHRESFDLNVKRLRFFLHPRVYEVLDSNGLVNVAYEESLQRLRDEYAT